MVNSFKRKLSKSFLSFSEKIATDDEHAIAKAIGDFIDAFNERDIEKIRSAISDDAKIEGVAIGRTMSRNEYVAYLSHGLLWVDLFAFDDVLIRIENGVAAAHGSLTTRLTSGKSWQVEAIIKLRKKDEKWLIVETKVQVPRYLP